MKNSCFNCFFALLLGWTAMAWAGPDAATLLARSDQARGGNLPGLIWDVSVVNSGTGSDEQQPMRLRVKAIETASVSEVLEPLNSKGSKMLQVERNMWLTKPGLLKPVAISPRQRLTGQAAIGDIASTNYVKEYEAYYVREEAVADEPCYLLDLRANSSQSTYDHVLYWVSVKRSVGVKAEFYSLSGKRLKTALFEYGNNISVNGRNIPFVSRMLISDALTDGRTELTYGRVKVKAISPSDFDVSNL